MTTESEAAISAEKEYMERLGQLDSYPLWAYHRDGNRRPPKASPWVWRWKDWIDRRFMKQFSDFPTMDFLVLFGD